MHFRTFRQFPPDFSNANLIWRAQSVCSSGTVGWKKTDITENDVEVLWLERYAMLVDISRQYLEEFKKICKFNASTE